MTVLRDVATLKLLVFMTSWLIPNNIHIHDLVMRETIYFKIEIALRRLLVDRYNVYEQEIYWSTKLPFETVSDGKCFIALKIKHEIEHC